MCFKKFFKLFLVACMMVSFSSIAFAGPARPISSASCYAIASTGTAWKYGAAAYYSTTFQGDTLYLAIKCTGSPDNFNPKVYIGGSQVPASEVHSRNFYGDGNDNYTYEIYFPSKYASWGMIDVPIVGTSGGIVHINLNKIKTA